MRRKSTTPRTTMWIRAGVVVLAAASALVGTTAATRAFDPQHIIECFGWMLTDPEMHAANCLPSNVPPVLGPISGGGTSDDGPPSEDEICDFDKDTGDDGDISCDAQSDN